MKTLNINIGESDFIKYDLQHEILSFEELVAKIKNREWQAIQEILFLNQLPNMVASIHEAANEPLEQGIKLQDLDW